MIFCGAALPAEAAERTSKIKEAPQILIPAPSRNEDAIHRSGNGNVTIDYGNMSQGYVMVMHSATSEVLKVRITLDDMEYTYDLNSKGMFEVYPLQMGNGEYMIQVFSQVRADAYRRIAETHISVLLDDPNAPYLYPSQYVHYTANSMAVAKSKEICQGLETDREKVKAIYTFCSRRIYYDYIFAVKPKPGYVPDVDSVLAARKGICFDYAALMATMLRVQGIPTKLVIGYADRSYHAWNNVWLDGEWYRLDATYVATSVRAEKYRAERYY